MSEVMPCSGESMVEEGRKGQQRLLAAFVAMGSVVWILLFVSGLRAYPGSAAVYMLFSLVFLALLLSAFYRQQTYVYIFLAVLLWLGFWNKLAWSLVGAIHLPEPVGRFVPTAANWDEVLLVAIRTVPEPAGDRRFHLGSLHVYLPFVRRDTDGEFFHGQPVAR